ncbi:MAG: hypothetical protein J2P15_22250, partial [Micromonosporaceae bacterium]|nr:hypothetical protein [Micromonosporaceae bacterium]
MAGRHHRVRGGEIFQYRTGEPDVGTHRAGRRGRRSAAPEPEPPASDPDGDRGQPGDGTEWRPDPSGPPEPAATAPATSEANTVRLAIEASPAIPPQRAIEAPPTAPPARPAPTAAPTEPAPPTQQAAHWARNTPPPVQAPARQIAPWAQHTPNGGWPAQNAPTPVPPPLLQHSGGWPAQQAPESGPARGAAARQSGQSPARPPTKPGELPAAGSAARGGVRPRSNADLD